MTVAPAADPLAAFTPAVREWLGRAFAGPTPAQARAWPAIATGEHVLISAPTGSGKTLAAFLWGLDRLAREPAPTTRLVYVSPLKALAYDVDRNLRAPLRGIGADLRVGIRTGDTPTREREAMRRTPPDILITTPESLYLMLTSRARAILTGVEAVIVDEVHAVAATKRGAHLALTLERLAAISEHDPQRIGLSATQNPLEEVGRYLVGPRRRCRIVDAGITKELDLRIGLRNHEHSRLEPPRSSGAPPCAGPGKAPPARRRRATIGRAAAPRDAIVAEVRHEGAGMVADPSGRSVSVFTRWLTEPIRSTESPNPFMPATTDNLAAKRLAGHVDAAKSALLELAATDPQRWWRAVELKTQARNGWDPGAMSIAMAQLIDEGRFEVGARLEIRLAD